MAIVNILHLSDLHCGIDIKNETPVAAKNEYKISLDKLVSELAKIPKDYPSWKPDVVAVSGDIGWAASDADYQTASENLNKIIKLFDLSPDDIILCPGNHDIDRIANRFLQKIETYEEAQYHLAPDNLHRRCGTFESFGKFSKEMNIPPLKNSAKGHDSLPYLYGFREHKGLRFLVFNTAWNFRGIDEVEPMWIGMPAVNDILSQKNAAPGKGDTINVTLMHHPFMALHIDEQIIKADKPVVENTILKMSDIILVGHVHGEIRKSDAIQDEACVFTNGSAFDKSSFRKGCRILQLDTGALSFSTLVLRYDTTEHEWEIRTDVKYCEYNVKLPKAPKASYPVSPATRFPQSDAREGAAPKTSAPRWPAELRAWWIAPSWDPLAGSPLPIDDKDSICLRSLLLARTDVFLMALASDFDADLASMLENEGKHFSSRLCPKGVTWAPRMWTDAIDNAGVATDAGIIIHVKADDERELARSVEEAAELRSKRANASIIYHIWSDNLSLAARAAQQFAMALRKRELAPEVLAVSMGCVPSADSELDKKANQYVNRMNELPFTGRDGEINELLKYRDGQPAIWPYVIRQHARERDGKYRILGFVAAKRIQAHMAQWFDDVALGWFEEQQKLSSPHMSLLRDDEVNCLLWGIYSKSKKEMDSIAKTRWDAILAGYMPGSRPIGSLIAFSEHKAVDERLLSAEGISLWARTAVEKDYLLSIGAGGLHDKALRLAALISSPYGTEQIIRGSVEDECMLFAINSGACSGNDPQFADRISQLRQISRRCFA